MAIIKGKWKWNKDAISSSGDDISYPALTALYTSNNIQFTMLDFSIYSGGTPQIIYSNSDGPVFVIDSTTNVDWQDEYLAMDFGEGCEINDDMMYIMTTYATQIVEGPEEYNTKAINLNQLKRVYDNLNDKISAVNNGGSGESNLSLKNGEGACSLQQSFIEDGTIKGSKAYGKYSTALNQNNEAHQRNSFVTGGGNKVGLTEEEFNTQNPDGVDDWGTTYDKSNSFANAGGQENIVTGRGSHIGGGYRNTVHGNYSGIVAGDINTVLDDFSGVVAGAYNEIDAPNSGVLAGRRNLIPEGNQCSSISAGESNQVLGYNLHIGAGNNNYVEGINSGILAGASNNIEAYTSAVAAGVSNSINITVTPSNNETSSFIGGGNSNEIYNRYSGIVAGYKNKVSSQKSTVSGGESNTIHENADNSFIGGGITNEVASYSAGVLAGESNNVSGNYSGIVAGSLNNVSGKNSGILAGYTNIILVDVEKSSIISGDNNSINSNNSSAGGSNNIIKSHNSFAFGTGLELKNSANSVAVGQYNASNSAALFQVGTGSATHRRNTLEVFRNDAVGGVVKVSGKALFTGDVDFSSATVIGLPSSGGGSGGGPLAIPVNELPIENIDDSKIYILNEVKHAEVYYFDGAKYCTLSAVVLDVVGVNPTVNYYVINELPTNAEITDLQTFSIINCYIFNNVAYVYGNAGSGDMWLTVSAIFAQMGNPAEDKGRIYDLTDTSVETGLYVYYEEPPKKFYLYSNNEWEAISNGSGLTQEKVQEMINTAINGALGGNY